MFKLYEQERCFGDQRKHSSIESIYVIEKYVNDVLQCR